MPGFDPVADVPVGDIGATGPIAGTVQVSVEAAYVPLVQGGMSVPVQAAYIAMPQTGMFVPVQAAYVVLLPPQSGSGRRRQVMHGSF